MPSAPIKLELAPPVDHGTSVDLTWRAPAGFTLLVLIEGEPEPRTLFTPNKNTMTVPVEPGRKYCFSLQATDATGTISSDPQPLREATCR